MARAGWRSAAVVAAILCGCTSTTTHTGNSTGIIGGGSTGSTTTGGSAGGVQASSVVSGTVSSTVVSGSQKFSAIVRSSGDTCAGQSFSVYEVGGDGTAVGSGSVNGDGSFSITWTTTLAQTGDTPAEAVLVFNCATAATNNLTCYGKPGDSTLVCDPISNALVAALEQALAAKVESSPLYKGLSIAKIAEGLVETLKLVSRLNPTQDYVSQLAAATSAAQITAIINSSPVGSLFQSIQTLAAQAVAQNTSITADANNQRLALQAVWSVDKVVALLAGSGLQVGVDFDDPFSSMYGPLVKMVDTATGTTFMEDMQIYMSTLYGQIYIDKSQSQLTLLCTAQHYNSNGGYSAPIVYAPDVLSAPLTVGNSNSVRQLTCVGPTAVKLKVAVVDPNTQQASVDNANNYSVSAAVASAAQESDRNDPDGTHQQTSQIPLQISLLDVFPELTQAIEPNGICANDYASAINGNDFTALGSCIRSQKLDKYFSGVLGLYRFLTDPTLHNIRVSLDDIYTSLVDLMGLRLSAQFDTSNYGTTSFQLTDVSYGDDDPAYVDFPTLLFDTQPADPNNTVYQSYCPDALCSDGTPNDSASSADVIAVMNASRPGFNLLFGSILNLPSLDTIKTWIFASDHHVDYNTAGNHYYPAVGKDDTGDGTADRPILCKLFLSTDPNTLLTDYQDGATVACEAAQGNWLAGVEQSPNGTNQVYKDYTHWFGLQQSDQVGGVNYYALIDLYTGEQVSADGQNLRVFDTSVVSGTIQDDYGSTVVADGTSVFQKDSIACQTYTDSSGQYQSSCYWDEFEFLAVAFPNQNNRTADANTSFYAAESYAPYSWTVPINTFDPRTGISSQQHVQIAISTDYDDWTNTDLSWAYSVCVSKTGVTVDPNNWGTVTSVSLTGNVGDCSDDSITSGGTYYYLALWYSPSNQSNDPNAYNYTLLRNDGLQMGSAPCGSGFCPATVLMTDVSTALDPSDPQQMGPQNASAYLPGYNVANPRYNAKFDPYCLDQDGDGHCDCFRDPNNTGVYSQHLTATSVPTDANCNLSDQVGNEPTLSTPPSYDANSLRTLTAIADPKSGCGNLGAQLLQGCLIDKNVNLNSINVNWSQVFSCVDANRQISYVNINLLNPPDPSNTAPPVDPNAIGGNCGPSGQNGPVVLNALAKRNNAYDISKPQTVLSLISTATQDSGTGVTIGRSDNLFTFNQALSMAFFRLSVPVTGMDIQQVQYGAVTDYPGLIPTFAQVNLPWLDNSGVPSAVLRTFLQKGGFIPTETLNDPNNLVH